MYFHTLNLGGDGEGGCSGGGEGGGSCECSGASDSPPPPSPPSPSGPAALAAAAAAAVAANCWTPQLPRLLVARSDPPDQLEFLTSRPLRRAPGRAIGHCRRVLVARRSCVASPRPGGARGVFAVQAGTDHARQRWNRRRRRRRGSWAVLEYLEQQLDYRIPAGRKTCNMTRLYYASTLHQTLDRLQWAHVGHSSWLDGAA
eukprot:scaffold30792_cov63-Phaeocystis_antarctica.AAC.4